MQEQIERGTICQIGGWAGGATGRVVADQGVKRQSRWAVAMADAEIGAVLGIETGPGAIVTGLVGGLVSFVMADAAADPLLPDRGDRARK